MTPNQPRHPGGRPSRWPQEHHHHAKFAHGAIYPLDPGLRGDSGADRVPPSPGNPDHPAPPPPGGRPAGLTRLTRPISHVRTRGLADGATYQGAHTHHWSRKYQRAALLDVTLAPKAERK